jgi:hypothetical protein
LLELIAGEGFMSYIFDIVVGKSIQPILPGMIGSSLMISRVGIVNKYITAAPDGLAQLMNSLVKISKYIAGCSENK